MTTPRAPALVSLVAAAAVTLASGACARAPSPAAWDVPAAVHGSPIVVRFDNEARMHVHVYLVGEQREWLLGRVEPGARAMLRIPAEWLAGTGFVRLAALAGAPPSARAAQDPRATLTIAQPAAALLSQRWTFSQGPLSPPQLSGARAAVGRR